MARVHCVRAEEEPMISENDWQKWWIDRRTTLAIYHLHSSTSTIRKLIIEQFDLWFLIVANRGWQLELSAVLIVVVRQSRQVVRLSPFAQFGDVNEVFFHF